MSDDRPLRPLVRSRWAKEGLRGVWTVQKVGSKYVFLSSNIPGIAEQRVDCVMWPGSWKPA